MTEIFAHIAIIICLLGGLLYLISSERVNARWTEVFRLMFFAGLLAVLLGK